MNIRKFAVIVFVFALNALMVSSCSAPRNEEKVLRMATTSSTENSGLLDAILPDFEHKTGIKVDVIAVGTGKALKLGENGDVDVLLVHAPAAEKEFIKAGFGTDRTQIMYNDFIILGPENDPAGVKGMNSAVQAMKMIEEAGAAFISRGDDSGTNKKERELWGLSGTEPAGDWYMEVGKGMGGTLVVADEKQAYTLSDRGTYLYMMDKLSIVPLVQGDPVLYNIYSVIPVSPDKHPEVKIDLAEQFLDWITDPETLKIIAGYKVSGQVLFHPFEK